MRNRDLMGTLETALSQVGASSMIDLMDEDLDSVAGGDCNGYHVTCNGTYNSSNAEVRSGG